MKEKRRRRRREKNQRNCGSPSSFMSLSCTLSLSRSLCRVRKSKSMACVSYKVIVIIVIIVIVLLFVECCLRVCERVCLQFVVTCVTYKYMWKLGFDACARWSFALIHLLFNSYDVFIILWLWPLFFPVILSHTHSQSNNTGNHNRIWLITRVNERVSVSVCVSGESWLITNQRRFFLYSLSTCL